MTFIEHKAKTVEDLKQIIKIIEENVKVVEEGDLLSFEKFWHEGGTEEGDAGIFYMRELLLMRYFHRQREYQN